jgi:hypothetical protein
MASTSDNFPPLEVSVTSRFPTYRLMYYIRELLEIIQDCEPSRRKAECKVLTDELNSFETKPCVLQIVSSFVSTILAFDKKSKCPRQTSRNEACLHELSEHAEFWFDCLGINSPPQLYYVLDNLQDDVEDIENKLKRAVLEDYKNVYQAALNLAKKVYDILSLLLASEE